MASRRTRCVVRGAPVRERVRGACVAADGGLHAGIRCHVQQDLSGARDSDQCNAHQKGYQRLQAVRNGHIFSSD